MGANPAKSKQIGQRKQYCDFFKANEGKADSCETMTPNIDKKSLAELGGNQLHRIKG